LIWVRALTGLGLGGALPMLLALVTENSAVKRQSASVATVYAAMPLGGAAASLLIMLMATAHWRAIFVVGGVLPLLLAPLMALWLPESAAFRRVQQDPHAHQDPRVQQDARAPRAPMTLRAGSFAALFADGRAGRTLLLWVSFLLELLLLYLLLNWLPTLLVSDGLDKAQAAGAQIGFNLGGVVSALLIGYLLGGRWRTFAIVITFVSLPILLVLLASLPSRFGAVASAVFLLGCAVLAAQAFLYTVAPVAYPTRIRGVGVGAAVAFGRVGSIVGPKLGGMLKAAGHGPSQLLMDLLPIVIAGSLCSLWLAWEVGRRRREDPAGSADEPGSQTVV
jgi:AAHS family 3-hydroxyphenylpropionic acid transporter